MIRGHWRQPMVLVMPTGTGKTVVAAMVMRDAIAKGLRCLIVSHTREIVTQTARRFTEAGIPSGLILAGERPDPSHPVQVASVQTLARRDFPEAEVVIIDECHHATAETYQRLIAHYSDKATIIGLTATPERLDGKGLRKVGFMHLLQPTSTPAMIDAGFLCQPRVFAPPPPDFKQTKARGDFTPEALAEYQSKLRGRVIDHYLQHAPKAKGVVFACNIEHSLGMVKRFRDYGIAAEHIDGKTPRRERDRVLAALRAGDIQIVTNCMILGEGWDLPDLEVAVLARPTLSLSLHRQQCGRVMRPTPGKQAFILDHAGNVKRHGAPWIEPRWSLDGKEAREAGEREERARPETVRFCTTCFCAYTPPLDKCPACGVEIEKPKMRETDETLVEVLRNPPPRVDEAQERLRAYRAWCREAFNHTPRRKLGWARHKYKTAYGDWPRNVAKIELEAYPCVTHVSEDTPHGPRCFLCLRKLHPSGHPPPPRMPTGRPPLPVQRWQGRGNPQP